MQRRCSNRKRVELRSSSGSETSTHLSGRRHPHHGAEVAPAETVEMFEIGARRVRGNHVHLGTRR